MGEDFLQKLDLTKDIKSKYPLVLLRLMKRYAEDLIWANKIEDGERVFKFIVDLTEDRADAANIRKGQFSQR